MSRLRHWMKHTGGQIGVWMYKRLDGRLSSGSKDVHVLMITTPGTTHRRPALHVRPLPRAA